MGTGGVGEDAAIQRGRSASNRLHVSYLYLVFIVDVPVEKRRSTGMVLRLAASGRAGGAAVLSQILRGCGR